MHRNMDILKETGELPVEEQLRQRRLQWLGHMQQMSDHRPQKQLLNLQTTREEEMARWNFTAMDRRHQQGPGRGDQLARGSERPCEMASYCVPAQTCHCVVASFLDPAQRP